MWKSINTHINSSNTYFHFQKQNLLFCHFSRSTDFDATLSVTPIAANSDVNHTDFVRYASAASSSSGNGRSSSRCGRCHALRIVHPTFDLHAKCLSSIPKNHGRMPKYWHRKIEQHYPKLSHRFGLSGKKRKA